MNKKNYKYLLLLICFIAPSCSGYLDEESKSQMTVDYYYTEKGMYEGVGAIYSSCREIFRENLFRINVFSDIAEWAASDAEAYEHVASPTRGVVNSLFADFHQALMLCNRMEQMIGDEPANRTQEIFLAEIRGLRAMFYQYCVELWGKYGHFQEKVYDQFEESMLEINQVSVQRYYEQILSDIDYAIAKLPKQSEISEYGRLSQGAAKALKARFLLAIAGYAHDDYASQEEHNVHTKLGFNSEKELYTQARQLAKSVINDYNYALCANYADNWDETKIDNSEVIWSVQWTTETLWNGDAPGYHRYGIGKSGETLTSSVNANGNRTVSSSSLTYTHNGKRVTFPSHSMYYGREYRYYMPSFKWLNMYSDKDQRRYDNFETVFYHLDDDKAAPYDLTDTVCYMPLRPITLEEDKAHADRVKSGVEGAYYLDGMNEVFDMDDPNDKKHYGGPLRQRSRYYNVKKFYDRTRTLKGKQEEGTKPGVVIRLAEMYLIDAECAYRLGEGDQAVYNALQPLWARAFDNVADANVYKVAPGTMDIHFIVDEYEREVGMEFNAFFILKRTRTLVSRCKEMPVSKEEEADGKNTFRGMTELYGDHLYIKPFPLSQAQRFKNMTREMLPPGYDYGTHF